MTTEDSFSIDELARAAGMTPRNVRAYRTKGLLPPPVRAGRVSQYRSVHLRRLRDIRELREAGLPLKLIIEAARRGADLGPASPLRGFAFPTGPVVVLDESGSRPAVKDFPQQRAAVRRLREVGFAPASAQLISQRIARHGAALAADLRDAVSIHAPQADQRGRMVMAELATQLTGTAVRRALGVAD